MVALYLEPSKLLSKLNQDGGEKDGDVQDIGVKYGGVGSHCAPV